MSKVRRTDRMTDLKPSRAMHSDVTTSILQSRYTPFSQKNAFNSSITIGLYSFTRLNGTAHRSSENQAE